MYWQNLRASVVTMAYQYLRLRLSIYLFLLMCLLVLNLPLIKGESHFNTKYNSAHHAKAALKTIQDDHGEVVDCVDMYSQPALNHPLLKNHKIQMNPVAPSTTLEENNLLLDLIQPWHKNGKCSKGTVPITHRRQLQGNALNQSSSSVISPHYESAKVYILSNEIGIRLHGASAILSIWAPIVARPADLSLSSLLVSISPGVFLAAGWIVYPMRYGDSKPRLFIHWMTDKSNNLTNLCWDLDCDGFVQVDNTFALGSPLQAVSTVGGTKQEFRVAIHQEALTKNWWLNIGNIHIGYWPASLIPDGIPDGANAITWGGTIFDSIGTGNHTETDMGNGLFANSNDASYMCQLRIFDESLQVHVPDWSALTPLASNDKCYNAKKVNVSTEGRSPCFTYGGPGRNPECP